MNPKKYQVFVSSTYVDLKEERKKILDLLLMADCIPSCMENFTATDDDQFSVIKRIIDLCDYYILIIGKRYGSINPTTELSYTEMEYIYAKEKEIPVLVFAIDDFVELTSERMDTDPYLIEKLSKFRKEAMSNRLASVWTTIDDLTGKVAISIMKAKNELKRPGWERAKDYDEVSLLREIREVKEENEMLHEQINKYFDIGKFPIGWRLHLISCMMQFSNVPLIDYHSVLENTYIFLEKMKTNEMDIIIQKEIENQLAKLHELIVEDMNDLRYR